MRKIIQLVAAVRYACGQRRPCWIGRIGNERECRFRQRRPKGDAVQAAVDIASVIKKSAAQLRADEWQMHGETKLLVEDQQCLAADGKSCPGIAGTRLVERKTSERRSPAGKETLRQGDNGRKRARGRRREGKRNGLAIRLQNPEPQGAREAETPLDVVVGGVLIKKTKKPWAGAEGRTRKIDAAPVKPPLRGAPGFARGARNHGLPKARAQVGV